MRWIIAGLFVVSSLSVRGGGCGRFSGSSSEAASTSSFAPATPGDFEPTYQGEDGDVLLGWGSDDQIHGADP